MEQHSSIDRGGIFGNFWAYLLGPNISNRELTVSLVPTLVATVVIPLYCYYDYYWRAQEVVWYQLLLIGFLSFDLIGGAIVNACESTKAWHHRRDKKYHFTFVAVHLHPFLVAWALGGGHFYYDASVAYIYVLAATLTILHSPSELKPSVTVVMYLISLALTCKLFQGVEAVSWVLPTYYLKLLLCYLTPPTVRDTQDDGANRLLTTGITSHVDKLST